MSTPVEDQAMFFRHACRTDEQFVDVVHRWVERNIRYVTTGGWEVKSAERTFREKTGDCSEKALLKEAMLKSQGIDARYIWGVTGTGQLHASVETHVGQYCRRIDERECPVFTKVGDGIHPREVVVQ